MKLRLYLYISFLLFAVPSLSHTASEDNIAVYTLLDKFGTDSLVTEYFSPISFNAGTFKVVLERNEKSFHAYFMTNDSIVKINAGTQFVNSYLKGLANTFLSKKHKIYKYRKNAKYETFSDNIIFDMVIYRKNRINRIRYYFGDIYYNGAVDVGRYTEEYTDELRNFLKLQDELVALTLSCPSKQQNAY